VARFNRPKSGHGLDARPGWPQPCFQTRPDWLTRAPLLPHHIPTHRTLIPRSRPVLSVGLGFRSPCSVASHSPRHHLARRHLIPIAYLRRLGRVLSSPPSRGSHHRRGETSPSLVRERACRRRSRHSRSERIPLTGVSSCLSTRSATLRLGYSFSSTGSDIQVAVVPHPGTIPFCLFLIQLWYWHIVYISVFVALFCFLLHFRPSSIFICSHFTYLLFLFSLRDNTNLLSALERVWMIFQWHVTSVAVHFICFA
jgi:hypothetical protein